MVETPSINANMIPPTIAFLNATDIPPLIANTPPVIKPAIIALNGSSFYL